MGLIRMVMLGLAAVLVYTVYRRVIAGPVANAKAAKEEERLGRLVQDPQCHVYVDSKDAVRREVKGGELYFCSNECAEAFLNENSQEQAGP